MNGSEVLGLIGGLILAVYTVPQLIRSKSTKDISLTLTICYLVGVVLSKCYLIYFSTWTGAIPLIISESILGLIMVMTKIYLDRKSNRKLTTYNGSSLLGSEKKGTVQSSLHPTLHNIILELEMAQSHLLGYQESRPCFSKSLAPFLDMHLNNAGDPFIRGNYMVQTKNIEKIVLQHYADLWNCPAEAWWGYMLSMGSTEGVIFSLMTARDYLRGKPLVSESNKNLGSITTASNFMEKAALKPVAFFSQDAHYCIGKACAMLKIKTFTEAGKKWYPKEAVNWPSRIASNEDGTINVDDLTKYVEFFAEKGHPIICVLTVGTTFKGATDDVGKCAKRVAEICERHGLANRSLNYERGCSLRKGYWIHIDGALGAGYLPFLAQSQRYGKMAAQVNFTFSNPHVSSISTSGHKWMGAPFPCGIYMGRKELQVSPSGYTPEYVGSPDSTLAGSRNGLSPLIFAQHILSTSKELEIKVVEETFERVTWFKEQLSQLGFKLGLDLLVKHSPMSLAVRFRRPCQILIDRYSISCEREKSQTGNQMINVAHIYIMRNTKKEMLEQFIADCEKLGLDAFPI